MPGNSSNFRTNLSLRRLLIDLNLQIDLLKGWVISHGRDDFYSTLNLSNEYCQSQLVIDILLLEDRRFFYHRGIELRALPRGFKRRLSYGKFGGISTIDQLLVRTCTMRSQRTIRRKTREILLALLLNLHCSKAEILCSFINSAYFGPRLNGADTAALTIFGVSAAELRNEYSAFIASLLPYPIPLNVSRDLRERGPWKHPKDLLEFYSQSNPWWTQRINARMRYVERLRFKYSIAALLGS